MNSYVGLGYNLMLTFQCRNLVFSDGISWTGIFIFSPSNFKGAARDRMVMRTGIRRVMMSTHKQQVSILFVQHVRRVVSQSIFRPRRLFIPGSPAYA